MFKVMVFVLIFTMLNEVICQGGLLGGRQPMDVKDDKLPSLVDFSISKINEERGLTKKPQLKTTNINIVKAESQVVAGAKYYITFETKNTNDKIATCNVVIWSKPWEDFTKLLEYDCSE